TVAVIYLAFLAQTSGPGGRTSLFIDVHKLCASPPTSGVVAQWGSKEAWEGRRSLGQCLRCGVDDHQIRDSEMLSALRPAAAAGVRVLEAKVDDAVVSESEKS
ncbi:hypothetical protein E4U31_007798, partial [Claviceps sp. LM219 group G6]